jgi:ElaB/YqjD/DUF883 family membrane-anchored ribosome-binding protein
MQNTEQEQLLNEVRDVLNNTEELLASALEDGSQATNVLRQRLSNKLEACKSTLSHAERVLCDKTGAAVKASNEYVLDNPWKAVGIGASIAFLLGLLVSRR